MLISRVPLVGVKGFRGQGAHAPIVQHAGHQDTGNVEVSPRAQGRDQVEFPSVQFEQLATFGRGGDLGAIGTPVQHNGHQTHDAGQFHNGPQNHDGRGLKGTDSEQFDQLRALGRVSAGGRGLLFHVFVMPVLLEDRANREVQWDLL